MTFLNILFSVMLFILGFIYGGAWDKSQQPIRYQQGFMDGVQARMDYENSTEKYIKENWRIK